MSADESKLHKLDGPDPVRQAATIVSAFCVDHALSPDSKSRVEILVEELVINLFDHGGLGPDDVVKIGLEREAQAVRLLVIDHGPPFDPRLVAGDGAIPDRGGGAGLALVNAWTEIIDYRTADGANRLELRIPT